MQILTPNNYTEVGDYCGGIRGRMEEPEGCATLWDLGVRHPVAWLGKATLETQLHNPVAISQVWPCLRPLVFWLDSTFAITWLQPVFPWPSVTWQPGNPAHYKGKLPAPPRSLLPFSCLSVSPHLSFCFPSFSFHVIMAFSDLSSPFFFSSLFPFLFLLF